MSSNAHFFLFKYCLKRTKISKNATSCSRVSDDTNCPRYKDIKI